MGEPPGLPPTPSSPTRKEIDVTNTRCGATGGVLIGGLLLLTGLVLLFALIGTLFGVVLMGAVLSLMLLTGE